MRSREEKGNYIENLLFRSNLQVTTKGDQVTSNRKHSCSPKLAKILSKYLWTNHLYCCMLPLKSDVVR